MHDLPNSENQANQSDTPNTQETSGQSDTGAPRPHRKLPKVAILAGIVVLAGIGIGVWLLIKPAAQPAANKQPTLKVGFMATGDAEISGGIAMRRGIEMAKKDFKAANAKIEIVEKETNCDADSAVKAMREFAAEKVVAVIGENCSDATLAAAKTANDSKIPLISPSSTSPEITDAGDYIFRTIPSDALTGVFTANVFNKKHYTRVSIIYEAGDPYTIGLRDSVKASVEKSGGQVVASESFATKATEVHAQMKRIKAANPDVLYIASGPTAPVSLFEDMSQLGLNIPVYGSESLQDHTFLDDAGALANGLNIVTVSEGTEQFVEKHRAAYSVDPEVYTAQSYDAYGAIVTTVNNGAATGEALKNALYKVDFEGASGHIKFDSHGDVTTDHFIYEVIDRKVRPVTL